jgi:hypothetical protein
MADAFDQVPAQGAKPAGDAFDQIQTDKPLSWMDQAVDYAKGAWDNLKQTGQGMVNLATTNPATTLKNIGQAQDALRVKAETSFKSGDYVSGARHFIDYMLPLIGPVIDAQGDEAASGRPGALAHSLGGATSLGLQLAGPGALDANAGAVANTVDATVKGAKAVGTGIKVAAPDVAGGLARVAAGEVLGKIPGMEWPARLGFGIKGVRQIGKGLDQGVTAARDYWQDLPEPPAIEPAPTAAPAPPPAFALPSGRIPGYIPGEPPEVTAMRARLNGNGSAPTAQPPAPGTQNPAPYAPPDVPGALPGEPPAVTAMRQRLNGNGNGSAAPAPDSQAQAQLLDDIAKGQLGPKASFAKLSADQQDVVRRIAASMDPTPKAAGAVSRTVEPSGTVPAPSPAPSTQDPAPATVYPNVGKTQPGYEDTLGPGLNVFRVPIGDVIPTENPYGLGKGAKVSEYGARIQNGETPPPLYGRYDPTKGGVVLGDGNTRLEALRQTGAQTVDVATSNPKGFEAPAPAAQPTPEQMASVFQPESPRSAYTAAGVRKSPELRAAEIINAHQDARAVKIADYMVANKVDPQMADFQTLGAAANAENPSPTTIGKALTLWKNGTTRAQTPHWHTGHMPRTTQQ